MNNCACQSDFVKVSGSKIRQHLSLLKMEKEQILKEFTESVYAFNDETKSKPQDVGEKLYLIEKDIVSMEFLQEAYNNRVIIHDIDNSRSLPPTLTLTLAIKLKGVLTRMSGQWQKVSDATEDTDPFSYSSGGNRPKTRNLDENVQVQAKQITSDEVYKKIRDVSIDLIQLSGIINKANEVEIAIHDCDEILFNIAGWHSGFTLA